MPGAGEQPGQRPADVPGSNDADFHGRHYAPASGDPAVLTVRRQPIRHQETLMTIAQLEHLADGLSVSACGQTFVVDRTRVRRVEAGHDVSFVIAGTDLAPRVHLGANQLASSSWEDMSAVLRHLVARLACRG
jgi:hypothetical protein